ncbi:hypothetical protein IAT38_004116 [Cryptococcus sp. DSM 104549]
MALRSTYNLHHSLPHRSPTQPPRSLSLSEYQPLSFDREALESAYQASLVAPSSSYCSTPTNPSHSQTSFGPASVETHDTSFSSFSHQIKAGEKPDGAADFFPLPPSPPGNRAGVGAGHTLTPPQSPLHRAAQTANQQVLLSPVPGSPPPLPRRVVSGRPPSSGTRPLSESMEGYQPQPQHQMPPMVMRRSQSDVGTQGDGSWQGQREWIEGDGRGRGKKRALPPVPTNVPRPDPPQWEPDYKSHIPASLTAPSIEHAYASLSAPPPNLPPRKNQRPSAQQQGPTMGLAAVDASRLSAGHSGSAPLQGVVGVGSTSGRPITDEPLSMASSPTSPTSQAPPPHRPEAEPQVFLRSTDKTPIWSTHYLDPCLRPSLINVPHQVTNIANVALSGLSSGPKTRYNATIGAPIDGVARMAKEWAISADGRFVSEHGGVELSLGVIRSGEARKSPQGQGGGDEEWGKDKGRKMARVEIVTKSGGVKVDLIELDKDRQIDLRVDTKSGDVLILLPDNFLGPIHITSPSRPPVFLPILATYLKPTSNPYASLYTTYMVPLALARDPRYSKSAEYQAAKSVEKYVPKSFREESAMLDQVTGGWVNHVKKEQSKVTVKSAKGRVVVGLRDSRDEVEARGMGLSVGMDGGKKEKKKWWKV